MATYEITLRDRTVEVIDGADAYQQEGQMTTFFATREGRHVVDSWSDRVASFRTSEVVIIRRAASTAATWASDQDRSSFNERNERNALAGRVPVDIPARRSA